MLRKLTAVWIAGLVAISLQPMRPKAGTALSLFHRPFHAVAFALTALLLWRSLAGPAGSRFRPAAGWVAGLAGSVALGLGIEISQHLIYGCGMEWADVGDDSAAAAAAIVVGCAIRAAWRYRESL